MRWSISTILLFALLFLCGCSSGLQSSRLEPERRQNLGKINIYYQYTPADATAAPKSFNVKRSDNAKGPFVAVNPVPISAHSAISPGDRQLLLSDKGLPMGRDFYYYIEKVDARGIASKATNVARASVVIPMLDEAKSTEVSAPFVSGKRAQ